MSTPRPAPLPADPVLSVVMPVYNERTTVEEIIRRVLAVPMRVQLIVVDDGSKDGSGEILERLQPELGFTLIRQANAGKGAALRTGFEQARGTEVGERSAQRAEQQWHQSARRIDGHRAEGQGFTVAVVRRQMVQRGHDHRLHRAQ